MPTRKEMGFRQLCAVAADQHDCDSSEWKERIKDRAFALGYRTPLTEQVYRAMDAVEASRRPPRSTPPQTAAPSPSPSPRSLADLHPRIRALIGTAFQTFSGRAMSGSHTFYQRQREAAEDQQRMHAHDSTD